MSRLPALPLLAALLIASEARGETGESAAWEATLERVVPAVVALRVSATRPFDTEGASVSMATGFVVDAERGLILTNRHVVHPGPVVAEAVFLNHEKVEARPLYRDPVHDFGFFRYDPARVRFMVPTALELAPEAAHVGLEVRVVGNDAGEKLSILDGTLARLDREAPRYGDGRYNDFNTFYLQAASSSSGGSSGSPVVDRRGRVIGLNAGGHRRSASSFFLPLERVARALERIQNGEPVTRGTLQTVFRLHPYDELRRLGLRPESEERLRGAAPEAVGLLVVSEVVPGGPVDGFLEPGDILLEVEGQRIVGFAELEAVLDGAVGREVTLALERGGLPVEVRVRVGDLHAVTPSSYLEMGGGVLHSLSYQQARNYGVPARGVYLASRGYAFARAGIPARVVITELDGRPVPDLATCESVLAGRADGAAVLVRYFQLVAPRDPRVGVLRVDRRWFPMQRCERDDVAGLWHCQDSPPPPRAEPPGPASTRIDVEGSRAARALASSLALVEFDVPLMADGVQGSSFSGAGLIVDAERGLVVVDRDTVPVTLGDVRLTFGGSLQVDGEVVLLHPDHNLAVVRYDPKLLGGTPLRSAEFRSEPLRPDEALWLVAFTSSQQLVSRASRVARVEAVSLPVPRLPRFRETNAELVALTETAGALGGVLADEKGRVRAFWASFSHDAGGKPSSQFAGIPASLLEQVVSPLRRGEPFVWHSLGVELETLTLAQARERGLPQGAARRLEEHDPLRRRALAVRRLEAGTPAAERLRVGDLLLAVEGRPATRFEEVERAAQAGGVRLEVLREGEWLEVELPTTPRRGTGTERVVAWAGALLQVPPREVSLQRGVERDGVYVAGRWRGSPADRHGLLATRRITAVDGEPVSDLDAFLAAVEGKSDRDSVRLRTVSLEGTLEVLTLEVDLHYWPSYELRRGADGWVRTRLSPRPVATSRRTESGRP